MLKIQTRKANIECRKKRSTVSRKNGSKGIRQLGETLSATERVCMFAEGEIPDGDV